MKTNIIEVDDLLSVLTVDEVEKRLAEVAGVESATVNYAAKNATVRYDETLLEVADIKVLVHQRGQHASGESHAQAGKEEKPEHKSEHKPEQKPDVKPTSEAAPVSTSPKADPVTPAAELKPAAADAAKKDKADPIAPPPDKK